MYHYLEYFQTLLHKCISIVKQRIPEPLVCITLTSGDIRSAQDRIRIRLASIANSVALINRSENNNNSEMAKFDGIKGQELLDVELGDNEITLIFKDNRFLFVRLENGRFVCESVPE
ncbi:MAG: hypothetical protein DLM72_06320 [Candidatus Nitrosopolaris wilkensis]|nr:MAG: hypothetical protein DLM72_06320 [Candidatus Nitrosopolaris wilkensis]